MTVGRGWRRLFRLRGDERSLARDVDDELAFHLAMREEKLRARGLSADEARTGARSRFGDQLRIRDECLAIDSRYAQEMRLMEWFQSVGADLRYALRTLRRTPAFTAVIIVTLALGIGATSAIFTLVDGILLRPLPYPEPDRIVRLIQSYPERGLTGWGVSQQNIALYRDRGSDFEAFSAYGNGGVTLTDADGAARLPIARVTADFFRVMGVNPAIGRAFTREEDTPATHDVAVISHALWESRFGSDPSIVGRAIDLDGKPVRVLGVMPAGFAFPSPEVKAWLAMGLDPNRRFGWINTGVGRLKPGVSVAHAERQTTAIMWDWARGAAQASGTVGIDPSRTHMKTIVTPLQQAMTRRTSKPLTTLLGAVFLILLIATANVATLLSSRAAAREREISVRAALGASRSRVVRQLITESITLSLIGGLLGVVLAYFLVRTLTHSSTISLPRIGEVTVDARVLAVTFALSLLSGTMFGLLPAVHATRARLASALAAGQRGSGQQSVRRANSTLVVAQLALAIVLLVSAGLMLESFRKLMSTDLGYRTDDLTTVALPLPPRINSAGALNAFVQTTLGAVRAVPGVRSAALGWTVPFEGNANVDGYLIDGRPTPASGNEDQITQIGVSSDYFSSLGIPLLYGRDVRASDDTTGLPVALVDDLLAKRYWKGTEALGKRIRVTGDTTWFTIVGVVGNVRDQDAASPAGPHLYNSLPQVGGNRLSLVIKTPSNASATIASVRRAIASLEPGIPLDDVRSVSSFVDRSLDTRRLTEVLLAAFAALAVLLAAVGVYGVMALSVANRHREFGIRLAVGAAPSGLVRLVLGEGARLAVVGVILGAVGALAATRYIASQLYEVSPTDPLIFGLLSLLLVAITLAACYIPARRAAASDPLLALRED
jgi:predicted permease